MLAYVASGWFFKRIVGEDFRPTSGLQTSGPGTTLIRLCDLTISVRVPQVFLPGVDLRPFATIRSKNQSQACNGFLSDTNFNLIVSTIKQTLTTFLNYL